MTPDKLSDWLDACAEAGIFRSSHKKQDAAKALGITDDALTNRLKGRVAIRRETALACRAIYHRLEPYGS